MIKKYNNIRIMNTNFFIEKDIYKLKVFFIYLEKDNIIEIEMVKIKINNNIFYKKDQIYLLHKYQYLNENKFKVVDIIYQNFKPDINIDNNSKVHIQEHIEDIKLEPTYEYLQEISGVYIFLEKIENIKNIKFLNNKSKKRKIKI